MRSVYSAVVCGLMPLFLFAGCGGGSSGGSNQSAPQSPTANAGGPYSGAVGTAVGFSGSGSSDPQGQTLTYAWNFGDSSTGTGVSPSHTYAAPGTYNVSLTVTNTSGLTGSATSKATIAAAAPVANAGGPYTGTVGTAVSFVGSGSSDPQGQTLTYAWNFGDSSAGTGVSPSHTYAAAGTYNVSLTVTNTSGLTGSATSKATIAAASSNAALTGTVDGGQLPISGAHVYLFAANTTGYGQASVSLLSAAQTGFSDSVGAYVPTASNGSFSLTGEYSCTGGQQLYLYVLGGNSGSGTGLMAAIGSCPASGSPAITVTVNEVTTIAAAYAMAGFATDATHVSSSGTALAQIGVANAFANAGNLANVSTGAALATTPSGNGAVPQAEINTLANVLASCVNSSSACSGLMADATSDGTTAGTKPTDTATAAINIAHSPGANVAALYGMAGSVFTPKLASQPNDFTIVLNFTGGGLNYPAGVAVDGSGNVWVANYSFPFGSGGSVTEISSSGAFLSGSSGFTTASLIEPLGVAIDSSGNAWVASNGASSFASEISSAGSFISLSQMYVTGSSAAVAIDGTGNAWFAGPNTLYVISHSGASVTGSSPYSGGGLAGPLYGIAIDGAGSAWTTDSTGHANTFSSKGAVLSGTAGYVAGGCCSTAFGIAIDGSGNAWITDKRDGSVFEFTNSGTLLSGASGYTGGGIAATTGIAIDGAGTVWVLGGNGIKRLSSTGAVLSGTNGYQFGGLFNPFALAVDGSGNVWVSNNDGPLLAGSVVEYVGVGTPVIMPIAAGLPATATSNGSSNLGSRP